MNIREPLMDTRDSTATAHYSGEPTLWVLLLGDIVIYSVFLIFLGFDSIRQPELFQQTQAQLNAGFGFFNTLVLLTGSWLVVRGLQVLGKDGDAPTAQIRASSGRFFGLALFAGVVFAVSKTVEYTLKAQSGIEITDNIFFTYYFALTGFHLVHVLIGMVVLWYMRCHVRNSTTVSRSMLESGANFWHLVDMLWILLFPIIYLV